jgi:hypothetical protein
MDKINIRDVVNNADIVQKAETKVNDLVKIVLENDKPAETKVYDLVKFFSDLTDTSDKLNELKIKLSFTIDDKVLELVKLIVDKSPESFKTISKTFSEIIADGKLDASDIPKVVLLVSNLYKTDLKQIFADQKLKVSNLLDLIKFLVHSIIELDLVPVENKEKILEVLNVSLTLLDSALELPIPSVKEVGNFFAKYFSCFLKK